MVAMNMTMNKRIRAYTACGFLWLLATLVGCTIGGEEMAAVDDQEATNRPYKNGCAGELTTSQCAAKKGVTWNAACGFRQRVPNAYFKVDEYGLDEWDSRWRYERPMPMLDPGGMFCDPDEFAANPNASCHDMRHMALDAICHSVWVIGDGRYGAYGGLHSYVPTVQGCAELNGVWRGGYCVAR